MNKRVVRASRFFLLDACSSWQLPLGVLGTIHIFFILHVNITILSHVLFWWRAGLLQKVLGGSHQLVTLVELITAVDKNHKQVFSGNFVSLGVAVSVVYSTYLMKRSSNGLSSRLRGSTLSGTWAMVCHSRLRKFVKSVRSLKCDVWSSWSRNRTPTSPLSITSVPGPLICTAAWYFPSFSSSSSNWSSSSKNWTACKHLKRI